jgi:steroid 5-alpha reductase family enzyme
MDCVTHEELFFRFARGANYRFERLLWESLADTCISLIRDKWSTPNKHTANKY